MAAGPQRRTEPAPHLLAHVAGVERALLARADALDAEATAIEEGAGSDAGHPERTPGTLRVIADEFRALSEELHFW